MGKYFEETIHEQLTNLLMENGCSVSKPGIDALCHWIALRDQSTVEHFIQQAERNLAELQRQTNAGTQDLSQATPGEAEE